MKKTLKTQLATFAALLVCVGISTSAQASDRKIYPGASCVEAEDAADPEIFYTTHGAAWNKADWRNWWTCPIVRDNSGSGMDVTDWDISVNRGSSLQTSWSITICSTDRRGYSGWQSTITVPTGSSSNEKLDGGSINSAYSDGLLYIRSYMPANAFIYSYAVSES